MKFSVSEDTAITEAISRQEKLAPVSRAQAEKMRQRALYSIGLLRERATVAMTSEEFQKLLNEAADDAIRAYTRSPGFHKPATRLYFDGRVGMATYGGFTVALDKVPEAVCPHTREIDYRDGRGSIRVSAQAFREMSKGECAFIESWLKSLSDTVNAFINKPIEHILAA